MKLKLSAEFLKRCAEGDDIPACPHCGVMAGNHLEGCPTMTSENGPALYHGGLMRCCVATWLETETLPTEPGARITCKYCGNPIRRREDGDWEWDYPEKGTR